MAEHMYKGIEDTLVGLLHPAADITVALLLPDPGSRAAVLPVVFLPFPDQMCIRDSFPQRSTLMQRNDAGQQCALDIDDSLVGASLPMQLVILQRGDKLSVHHHIHLADQRQVMNLLPVIAGIQPDGFVWKSITNLVNQLPDVLPVVRVESCLLYTS